MTNGENFEKNATNNSENLLIASRKVGFYKLREKKLRVLNVAELSMRTFSADQDNHKVVRSVFAFVMRAGSRGKIKNGEKISQSCRYKLQDGAIEFMLNNTSTCAPSYGKRKSFCTKKWALLNWSEFKKAWADEMINQQARCLSAL